MSKKSIAALRLALVVFFPVIPVAAQACSSCGCTLNSDWTSQGLRGSEGLSADLRFDAFDQNQLLSGRHAVNASGLQFPQNDEIQHQTMNRNATLALDYGINADWALTVQLPYLSRRHSTTAEGDTALSYSSSDSLGDVRVMARYMGLTASRNWGLQFGLKLPTGATDLHFNAGPQAGQPLDAGLQPGTGSADLLLGGFHFGSINAQLDYFTQIQLELPVATRNDFRPSRALNLSAGLRYVSDSALVPNLQINARQESREGGANADVPNSGATLVYLSPGATWTVSEQFKLYGFVQLPVYQRVNGLQIEPKVSASVGLHYSF